MSIHGHSCTALNEAIDGTAPSAEEAVIAEAERLDRQRLSQIVRDSLTETQYRRLCLYYLERMSESEIAESEGVGQSRISRSLAAAKGKLKKYFLSLAKTGAKNGLKNVLSVRRVQRRQ